MYSTHCILSHDLLPDYRDAMWASLRIEHLAIPMFVQQFIQAYSTENVKAYHCAFMKETHRYNRARVGWKAFPWHNVIEDEWRIYASVKHANIASDYGLSPVRRQTIIWANVVILSIRPQGTYSSEIIFKIQNISIKKMHLKMLPAKWRPRCHGINVLIKCGMWSSESAIGAVGETRDTMSFAGILDLTVECGTRV